MEVNYNRAENGPVEIVGPDHVQIMINRDGKTIWVNVDGTCIMRVGEIKDLMIYDERPGGQEPTLVTNKQ